MLLCQVDGTAAPTAAHPSLKGWKLLLCQPLDATGVRDGGLIVAIDALGAARGQRVIVSSDGAGVRRLIGHRLSPLRYMTIGVLDEAN